MKQKNQEPGYVLPSVDKLRHKQQTYFSNKSNLTSKFEVESNKPLIRHDLFESYIQESSFENIVYLFTDWYIMMNSKQITRHFFEMIETKSKL